MTGDPLDQIFLLFPLFYLLAPLLSLMTVGLSSAARHPRPPWRAAFVLFAIGTAAWLGYIGLYPYETPCGGDGTAFCSTVYGYDAPLEDGENLGSYLLLAGFVIPAAWVGWRRLTPALTAGAALALGPTVLAWWTTPRGDGDGLWVLIFTFLPMLGGFAAIVAGLATIASRLTERVSAFVFKGPDLP